MHPIFIYIAIGLDWTTSVEYLHFPMDSMQYRKVVGYINATVNGRRMQEGFVAYVDFGNPALVDGVHGQALQFNFLDRLEFGSIP